MERAVGWPSSDASDGPIRWLGITCELRASASATETATLVNWMNTATIQLYALWAITGIGIAGACLAWWIM
jgi:hypothetical protein